MQCKDIPDVPVLEFLAKLSRREIASTFEGNGPDSVNGIVTWYPSAGSTWGGCAHGVPHAMPLGADTPIKLVRAKMGSMIRRGLVNGCACGCRGDFELTDKGALHLASVAAQAKEQ